MKMIFGRSRSLLAIFVVSSALARAVFFRNSLNPRSPRGSKNRAVYTAAATFSPNSGGLAFPARVHIIAASCGIRKTSAAFPVDGGAVRSQSNKTFSQ